MTNHSIIRVIITWIKHHVSEIVRFRKWQLHFCVSQDSTCPLQRWQSTSEGNGSFMATSMLSVAHAACLLMKKRCLLPFSLAWQNKACMCTGYKIDCHHCYSDKCEHELHSFLVCFDWSRHSYLFYDSGRGIPHMHSKRHAIPSIV